MKITLATFLQLLQDMPFSTIGSAAAAGGLNIPLDVAAAQGIVAAVVKDIFNPNTDTTAATAATAAAQAPATTAAIADHVAQAS